MSDTEQVARPAPEGADFFGDYSPAVTVAAALILVLAISVIDLGEGPVALPAVEIEPRSGVFDYAARYTPGMTEYHSPARVGSEIAAAAADLAVRVHEALGLADLSPTDAIVAADGTVSFLEVNVSPGLTETSMFPMAIEAAGLEVGEVLAGLLARRAATHRRTES